MKRLLTLDFSGIISTAIAVIALAASTKASALTVKVDRTEVPLNETFAIEIASSRGSDLASIDLSGIEKNFSILNRSSQRSFSMVNGKTESLQSLSLTVAGKAVGNYTIPSLTYRKQKSRPIKMSIQSAIAPPDQLADETVILQAKVDKPTAYIGEQVLYTLSLMVRVGLSGPELTKLELENTDIKSLQDKSFQRQINGHNYQVIEKRYALFFQESGTKEIQGQTLTAILDNNSRSRFGFDPFARGKQIRLAADPVSLVIEPKPNSRSADWLPAESLSINENWDDAQQFVAGQPITRSIEVLAKGITAENLPSPPNLSIDGLNLYPEKPALLNQEWHGGIAGKRVDNLVIIPTEAGDYTLPAIDIDWWNINKQQMETASLPARAIRVAAPQNSNPELRASSQSLADDGQIPPLDFFEGGPAVNNALQTDLSDYQQRDQGSRIWQIAALLLLLLWLSTSIVVYRLSRQLKKLTAGDNCASDVESAPQNIALKTAKKRLINACTSNNAVQAKQALHLWLTAYGNSQTLTGDKRYRAMMSANDVLLTMDDRALTDASDGLNRLLFAGEKTTGQNEIWHGDALKQAVEQFSAKKHEKFVPTLPKLYPG